MNRKVLTLCVSALLASAWTTLDAKVVGVATPQLGNAYVIGTGVVNGTVSTLLKSDGSVASEGTEATAAEVWTLEAVGNEDGVFYLKNSEGKYLIFDTSASAAGYVGYSEEKTNAVKFKLGENNTLLVAEQVPDSGASYFKVNDAFTLTSQNGARVDYNENPEATPLAFAIYTPEEAYKGMPGLDDIITNGGVVDQETLTADVTVPAPLNIKVGDNYLSITTNNAGDYVVAEGDDVIDELTASNSLAASWEWQNGYLVSTAALRAAEPERVYLVYDEETGFATVSTSIYNPSVPAIATNFANDATAKAALDEVRVSTTSTQATESINANRLGGIITNASNLEIQSAPSGYVIVKLGDNYLYANADGTVGIENTLDFTTNDYKGYLWRVSRSGAGASYYNFTFTSLATNSQNQAINWELNGTTTFVAETGAWNGLTLTNNGLPVTDQATTDASGTKAVIAFYEAPTAAKTFDELNNIYKPGFAVTIKVSKDGTETIEDVDKFSGTLYPKNVSGNEGTTVQLWNNEDFEDGHDARILVLDKTTKVGSDDNSNVEGSFKWITETELNKNSANYDTNFQFLYSLSNCSTTGTDIEWITIGGKYLYILSTGNNRYQLTTIDGVDDTTAQPYIVLQGNNVVAVSTLITKYLTFSFAERSVEDSNEEYKLNGVLSVVNRGSVNEADYVKASSVLTNAPETQWIVTDANATTNTFAITNREANETITGVTLRNNNDGTYTIYSTDATYGATINGDVVRMASTNIVGTRHMDGYMDAKPAELRNQVFHIGQYHYETGNSTAFWAENHQSNRSHQLGVTTDEENAVDWRLAIQMQKDDDTGLATVDADTIYVVRSLETLNPNTQRSDTLAILQYTFQNKENLEYAIYNNGTNLNYYQCQPDYSNEATAQRFVLKMKPDSTYNVVPVSVTTTTITGLNVISDNKVYVANSQQWGSLRNMSLYGEDNNSLMEVIPVDRPEYRQIEMAWGDTIKLWRNENESQVVYEKKDVRSVVENDTLSFLNIDNDNQFTLNPALFADTAYINRWDADGVKNTCYQYLLAVDVTNRSEYYCPLTPEHNTDAWREEHGGPCPDADKSAYVEGRFLVNLIDTANVYGLEHLHNNPYINRTEEGNDCAKLAFVPGKHFGDSLVIYRDEAMTDVVDTLYLGTEDFNVAKFAFKYEDVEEGSFKIQTQWKDYLATDNSMQDAEDFANEYEDDIYGNIHNNEGYLRFVNGCLVVDETYQRGDVFNMTERYTEQNPTANESIEDAANGAISVVATDGAVVIKGAEGKNVVIATILGKVVANETINSDNETIAVPAGIAVVSVDGESFKVVVK